VRKEKQHRLQNRGWKFGTTRTFLKLTPEEAAYIEIKLRLASNLRDRRQRGGFTQGDLAKRLRSSQSRVAKMEAGDPTVSVDLLLRSLLAAGADRKELARVFRARTA